MSIRSVPGLRRRLAATLDLTLWCLGCDVRHPDGNLLVRRGFVRQPSPSARSGSTMYLAPAAGSAGAPHLAAWGFALLLLDPACGDGLLLRRHDRAGARLLAQCALPAPPWTADALPAGRVPVGARDAGRTADLLRLVAGAIAEHERWVAAACGEAYRPACAAGQPRHVRRRQHVGATGLVSAWYAAADAYAALASASPETRPAHATPWRHDMQPHDVAA